MKRSTLSLLIVFVILGVAVVFIEQPFSKKQVQQSPDIGSLFPGFNRDQVTKIQFGSFGGAITLVKENDTWFVIDADQRFPADIDSVSKVFDTVQEMKSTEKVSDNPDKHITFQVNAPQQTETTDQNGNTQPFNMGTLGTEVIFFDSSDQELVHLFVGKNGSMDFMTTYVRKSDSNSVFLVEGYLKSVFGKSSAANWKDLTLCKVEPQQITKMSLKKEKETVTFESSESQTETGEAETKWRMTEPRQADLENPQMEPLINMFRTFKGSDYASPLDDPSGYGFEKPTVVATIDLKEGSPIVLTVGAETQEKANHYFVRKDNDSRIMIIPKYRVETLTKKAEEFLGGMAPPK